MKDQGKVSQCLLLLSLALWVQTLWCTAGNLINSWVRESRAVFVQLMKPNLSSIWRIFLFLPVPTKVSFITNYYHWLPISIHATVHPHVTYHPPHYLCRSTLPMAPAYLQDSGPPAGQWFSFFGAVYCITINVWLLAPFHKTELTETSISDNLVSIITLLSMLGLHLSIPTHANSVWDFLRGLERLEGLEKVVRKQTALVNPVAEVENHIWPDDLITNKTFQWQVYQTPPTEGECEKARPDADVWAEKDQWCVHWLLFKWLRYQAQAN